MKSKDHLRLVAKTSTQQVIVTEPKAAKTAEMKLGALAEPITGEITVTMGGKVFTATISGTEKFIHEMRQAGGRGKNPADALIYLSELAAARLNPHHSDLTAREVLRWEELFGPSQAA